MSTANEFWVRCRTCGHEWIAAYLPMLLRSFVKIAKGCACPKCGEVKEVRCGKAEALRK